MTEPPLLQVCPNDHPPFLDICTVYEVAAARIGRHLSTVFLSPANAEPLAGAVYLDCDSLRRTKPVLAAFESAMGSERLAGVAAGVALTICHRYRAYRIVRASRLASSPGALSRTVVVAHEFEFFGRWQRRIEQKLFARDVRFAGVSQPVVDELARTVKNPLLLPNGIDLVRAAEQRIERPEALAARTFAAELSGRLHLPVELWDERLTTVQAERTLLAGNTRRDRRRQERDRLAAILILQGWLDAHAFSGAS